MARDRGEALEEKVRMRGLEGPASADELWGAVKQAEEGEAERARACEVAVAATNVLRSDALLDGALLRAELGTLERELARATADVADARRAAAGRVEARLAAHEVPS